MKVVVGILVFLFGLLVVWRNKAIALRLRRAERGRTAGDESALPTWTRVYVGLVGLAFMLAGVGSLLQ